MPGGGQCWRGSSLASGLGHGRCVHVRVHVRVCTGCRCVDARACVHGAQVCMHMSVHVKDGESWSPHSNPVSKPQCCPLSCLTLGRQGTEGPQGRSVKAVERPWRGGQQGFSEPQGPGGLGAPPLSAAGAGTARGL